MKVLLKSNPWYPLAMNGSSVEKSKSSKFIVETVGTKYEGGFDALKLIVVDGKYDKTVVNVGIAEEFVAARVKGSDEKLDGKLDGAAVDGFALKECFSLKVKSTYEN